MEYAWMINTICKRYSEYEQIENKIETLTGINLKTLRDILASGGNIVLANGIAVKKQQTYSDLYNEFLVNTKTDPSIIDNYRPCYPPYYERAIPNAILVWLKDGTKMIYVNNGK